MVNKVVYTLDCGIVINPEGAKNLTEGAIVDALGNAFFGKLTFKNGATEQQNFDQYRMIRMSEAPKVIETYFVENDFDPTGMGEPAFPPVFAAVANALYRATGKRFYQQLFMDDLV